MQLIQQNTAALNTGLQDFVDQRAYRLQHMMKQAYKVPKLPDLISNDVSTNLDP